MKVRIKYHADIPKIKHIEEGDWIDLRAAENVFIPRGQYMLISLGISMELPPGYEAHIMPRSSTFKNYGIIMAASGIIDNSYNGDNDIWRFAAYCLEGRSSAVYVNGEIIEGTRIHKGDRICQFRIVRNMEPVEFEEVETLGNADRGGIGSTGIK